MKKILLIICCLALITGCGKQKENTKTKNSLLEHPSDIEIKEVIEKFDGVKSICLVTEDNDPNGNLNKQGGYIGAVYFRLNQVDEANSKEEYPIEISNDACEAGTNGGGQIEIYANENDAKSRDAYISTLDSITKSGYHNVRGTLVIRISDILTATQQKEIEEQIYNLLLNN